MWRLHHLQSMKGDQPLAQTGPVPVEATPPEVNPTDNARISMQWKHADPRRAIAEDDVLG